MQPQMQQRFAGAVACCDSIIRKIADKFVSGPNEVDAALLLLAGVVFGSGPCARENGSKCKTDKR